MGRLEGRVALITGGTSGIGEATVERFVEEGARVVFTGRGEDDGRRVEERAGSASRYFKADSSREEDVKAAVDFTVETFGRLDILFNNAGAGTMGDVETVTLDQFDRGMHLLVAGVMFGIKHAAPIMKRQEYGRIINNSSVAALRTNMGGYVYSAAKAAVTQATRMAGLELGRYGITVNSISPGAIATPIFWGGSAAARQLEPAHNEGKMRKLKGNLARSTPMNRSGLPVDIANAALFLASEEAGFVNCHDLVVDGGMIAGPDPKYE